jgi:hypothetical protein
MEPQPPTYLVCRACLVLLHRDCANIYEAGTCGCLCRHADVDRPQVDEAAGG